MGTGFVDDQAPKAANEILALICVPCAQHDGIGPPLDL